ncbi:MAG: HD domain-containing phosphohydrolase [Candidatus Sedimenticola sp. (ex Thyasira tokunagai)]
MEKRGTLIDRLNRLNAIGVALSAERDTGKLLDRILQNACSLTHADGGTLYLRSEEERCLNFKIMLTHSLGIHWREVRDGATERYPSLPLYDGNGDPNNHLVATYTATTGHTTNIPDVYAAEGFDFSGTHEFDERFGYRCRSFLAVPLVNYEKEVIGVLQLINAQDTVTKEVIPFSVEDQQLVESLASQAAVALTNQRFIEEQRKLFESLVKVLSDVIDERSPYTAGHCRRVSKLTLLIAEAVANSDGNLSNFSLSDEDRYELKIAGWLHDCGKITTPDHIIDKQTKLESIFNRVGVIELRFQLVKQEMHLKFIQQRGKAMPDADFEALEQRFGREINELDDDLRFILKMNIGGENLGDDEVARIKAIARRKWMSPNGTEESLLSEDEVINLTIRKGTLTDEERLRVNHHAEASLKMLNGLRFPGYLKNVPEYAGCHHEHIDGSGYPRGLTGEQMSIPARMMCVADIFEAVTARDRPYRDPIKLSQALAILCRMTLGNQLDADIMDVFIGDKVYMRYAEQFLDESQIDEVDETQLPDYR